MDNSIDVRLALLIDQTKDIPEIKSSVQTIKEEVGKFQVRIERNEKDISHLEKRSDGWNIINSVGVGVAGIIAWLRGG